MVTDDPLVGLFVHLPSGATACEPTLGKVRLDGGWTLHRLPSGEIRVKPPPSTYVEVIDPEHTWYEFAAPPVS